MKVTIALRNGHVDAIEIPVGVSVLVRSYDWVEADPRDLSLDDDGNFCIETVYTPEA